MRNTAIPDFCGTTSLKALVGLKRLFLLLLLDLEHRLCMHRSEISQLASRITQVLLAVLHHPQLRIAFLLQDNNTSYDLSRTILVKGTKGDAPHPFMKSCSLPTTIVGGFEFIQLYSTFTKTSLRTFSDIPPAYEELQRVTNSGRPQWRTNVGTLPYDRVSRRVRL